MYFEHISRVITTPRCTEIASKITLEQVGSVISQSLYYNIIAFTTLCVYVCVSLRNTTSSLNYIMLNRQFLRQYCVSPLVKPTLETDSWAYRLCTHVWIQRPMLSTWLSRDYFLCMDVFITRMLGPEFCTCSIWSGNYFIYTYSYDSVLHIYGRCVALPSVYHINSFKEDIST